MAAIVIGEVLSLSPKEDKKQQFMKKAIIAMDLQCDIKNSFVSSEKISFKKSKLPSDGQITELKFTYPFDDEKGHASV